MGWQKGGNGLAAQESRSPCRPSSQEVICRPPDSRNRQSLHGNMDMYAVGIAIEVEYRSSFASTKTTLPSAHKQKGAGSDIPLSQLHPGPRVRHVQVVTSNPGRDPACSDGQRRDSPQDFAVSA
jgi:hypothetical protein